MQMIIRFSAIVSQHTTYNHQELLTSLESYENVELEGNVDP